MKKLINIICSFLFILLPIWAKGQYILVSDTILAKALCQKQPSTMSPDCLSLDTIAAASVTGTLQLQNYGFNDVSQLSYFKSINFFQTVNNNIYSLPDFTGFASLKSIDIRGNPWVDTAQLRPVKNQLVNLLLRRKGGPGATISDFSFLNSFPNLKGIELKDFNATVMPDFSLYTGLTSIDIRGNKLSFKDLLPLKVYSSLGPNLLLFPQNKLTNDTTITVYCDDGFTITVPFDIGTPGITYSFLRNNTVVQSSASNIFHLDNTTDADTGRYQVVIRSNDPYFAGDSLLTGNYFVKLQTSNLCQDLFSPNNDGFEDELFIEGTGVAIIRNKQGTVVKKVSLPGYWDGTDERGNPVSIGLYSISIGSVARTVTVLR